jgi:hypothetical protein
MVGGDWVRFGNVRYSSHVLNRHGEFNGASLMVDPFVQWVLRCFQVGVTVVLHKMV